MSDTAPTEQLFYLVSLQHSDTDAGPFVCFWKPNGAGYTCFVERAGKYTREQTKGRVSESTIAVPCEQLEAQALRVVHVDAVAEQRAAWFVSDRAWRAELEAREAANEAKDQEGAAP